MDARALDQLMRSWAEAQHGLVGRDQLAAGRVDPRAVRRRLRSRDWELLTPRVLRLVGAPATDEQRAMAATLDTGPGAVASHATAAALWDLPGFSLRRLEVSRPRNGSRRAPSLARLHHPRSLPPHHCTRRRNVPVTTLARTVVDLSATEHPRRVELAAHAAVRLGVSWSTVAAVAEEVGGHGRPGSSLVRRLVGENQGRRPLESGLEAKVRTILMSAGLPEPRRQVNLGGDEWAGRVDFLYEDARLVLEVNGSRYHDDPLQRRRDDRRTAALVAAGFRVLPLTEELIRTAPHEVVRLVKQARRTST